MSVSGLTQDRYPHSPNGRSVAEGLEFQDYMMRRLLEIGILVQVNTSAAYQLSVGESPQQVEIKLDNRCSDTGRLSIEVAERSKAFGPWVASGIYAKPGSFFYVQGNHTVAYVFETRAIQEYHQVRERGRYEEMPTIRKFYLPLRDAEQLCIRKLLAHMPGQMSWVDPIPRRL